MEFSYLFSSQQGDVVASEEMLSRPFIIRPFERHPFINLKDYFDAIKNFIIQAGIEKITDVCIADPILKNKQSEIDEVKIRYEKYGTLYHIASVEIASEEKKGRFAVSTAIWPYARQVMDREFYVMEMLNRKKAPSYLPQVYRKAMVTIERDGLSEVFTLMLSQWFEDYKEWHFNIDENGKVSIILWGRKDHGEHYTEISIHEVIKKATYILTYYYDFESTNHIIPWHHSAGDFVLKIDRDSVDVRLVAARDYRPALFLPEKERLDPLKGLLFFLFGTTIKMRLDRQGGIGAIIIAGSNIIEAVMEGFLNGMADKEARGEIKGISTKEILSHLKSMNEKEINAYLYEFLDNYRIYDPEEALFFEPHIRDHSKAVLEALISL